MTETQGTESLSIPRSREEDNREHEEDDPIPLRTPTPGSHRFANAAYLSQYIPGLDPESERAKTFRTKMAKRSAMLMLQAGAALLVLILSSVFLIWAVRFRPPVRGVGDFLYGRCSTISFINFAIHVLINVISSLFLGAGNYCMQILIAPSREEINKAHRKGEYVEIGVPSVRNFWYIRWYRIAAWVFISLLATTLHVFWNSSIFISRPIVSVPRALVTSDFQTSHDDWKVTGPLLHYPWWQPPHDQNKGELSVSSIYNLQDQAVNFTRLDKRSCIQSFINQLESTSSVVIVSSNMTSMDNHGTSLLDGWISSWDGWWGWSNGWICLAYQADLQRQKYCTLEWSEIFVDNWTVGRRSPIAVDYCLVSETANNEERCGLHYSTHVLIIVCVCIFLESLMILWTWGLYLNSSTNPDIKSAKRTMVTMGDAIHSFLEHPLADGHNLMDSTIQGKKIRVNNERWTTRKLTRWYEAVSWCTWIVSGLLFAIGMGVCSYSVGSSCTSLLRRGVSHNSIWKQWFKFQPTMTNDMLGPLAKIIKTKTDAMLAHILIANSPQLLISFLYMLYNSILTRQLVADEWVRFLRPEGKRALRVSSLEGVQRSSYFLSLPLKYSIPLMVSSIALHSLASQSLFLVQTSAFGPGKDGERQPYFDYSSRGYSILASTIAISLALFLVILLILHSLYRNHSDIPANFQRMGLNSMALEAVCQTPVGDRDARFFPISLGIVSDVGNQDQRLVFSTDIHLHPPQQGQDYLQPIFVSRSWKGA